MVTATRREARCIAYMYGEDVIEPGLIHVMEQWLDQESLDRHFASEHLAAWRRHWPELGITNRDLVAYSVGDPRPT